MALPALDSTADALPERLAGAIAAAKGGRPLSPVAVVAPSSYAALAVRRQLVAGGAGVANVEFTTLGRLEQALAGPELRARGLVPVTPLVDLEVVRQVVAAGTGPWARLADHPRATGALVRAFGELRRWTAEGLQSVAGHEGRGVEVVRLLLEVRRRLHEHGLADELDVRAAAGRAAAGDTEFGPLVLLASPHLAPGHHQVLVDLGRRHGLRRVDGPASLPVHEVRPCADPDEEARAAVRAVVGALDDGVPLWRQGIFHPPGATYERLLQQHLAQAGLPRWGPQRRRLDRSAPGAVLLGLLELTVGDLSRHDVMAWLSSGPVVVGHEQRPAPVSRWNALSAAAGVVRGLDQWRSRLAAPGLDQRDGAEAEALIRFVEELAAAPAPGAASWSARAQWATGLLDRYLDPAVGETWPATQLSALAQVRDAVGELADLDAVSSAPDAARFRRAVRAQLEAMTVDSDDGEGGGDHGVLVAPVSQARGLALHTSVVVGLADDLLPGSAGDDPLLPAELCRLDDTGAVRPRAARQAELLNDVVAASSCGDGYRVATHPLVDPRTGRAQTPSRWLAALRDGHTVERPVSSFVAGLRRRQPALSTRELRLRAIDATAETGGPLEACAPVALDTRLRLGIDAVGARATRAFTRYDGLVGAGLVSPFDPQRPVSATRFELYPLCPRRFLFEKVLGISRHALPEELWSIEATSRGSVVHAILEQYVLERVAGAPRSLDRLLAIAVEHLDRAEGAGLVGRPLVWRLVRAGIMEDLRTLHREEGDMVPLAAEFSFGPDPEDDSPPVAVTLPDGRTVHFRGRADRVDRDGDQLVVSDYKTGRQSTLVDILQDPLMGGKRLQLPLYALAARARFGPAMAVQSRYWLVSAERSAASYSVDLTDTLEQHFAEVVGRIATCVDQGLFPAIPGEPREVGFGVCNYCDFDHVCSATRDRQWVAKRGAPELAPVNELRDSQAPETLLGSVVCVDAPKRVRR